MEPPAPSLKAGPPGEGGAGAAATPPGSCQAHAAPPPLAADRDAGAGRDAPPPLPPVSFFALYRYAAAPADWALLAVGTAAAAVHGTALPLFAILFGDLIDSGGGPPSTAVDATASAAWRLLLLGGLSGALAAVQHACWATVGMRAGVALRTRFTASLLRQEMGWYDGLSSGALTAALTGGVGLVQEGVGVPVGTCVQQVVTAVVGVGIAFAGSWRLTLVVLATAPALVAVGGAFGRLSAHATARGQASYSAAGAVAEEALTLLRTVVAYGGEATEVAKYDRLLRRAGRDEERRALLSGASVGISMVVMLGVYGLAFWWGNRLVRRGEVSAGGVVTVFFAIMLSAVGLGQTAPALAAIQAARGAAPRMYEVIERVSAIDPLDEGAGVVPAAVGGHLALRGLRFAYPSRPDQVVLYGISVAVERGQTLALVGASGCGKVWAGGTVVLVCARGGWCEEGPGGLGVGGAGGPRNFACWARVAPPARLVSNRLSFGSFFFGFPDTLGM